ncbi:MAG: hypothetical protein ABI193_07185 [Minicystis sp.]
MQSRLLLLLVLTTLMLSAGACAKGTAFVGTGGGDNQGGGSTSATTGSGGASTTSSTTTTTTGDGGSSTTTSSTTTTTTGNGGNGGAPCPVDPCKVTLPQCGCGVDEECGINGNAVACVPAGDVGLGLQCGLQGQQCGPGLVCVQTGNQVSTCVKFCDKDAECQAPGGLCLLTLNDGNNGSIPGVTLCTENCNPAKNTGCPVAGTACQLLRENGGQMRFLTRCGNAGAGMQNGFCASSDDCAPKFGCFNTDPNDPNANACFKWCEVNGVQSCPGGTICNALQTPILVGNVEYGVCF